MTRKDESSDGSRAPPVAGIRLQSPLSKVYNDLLGIMTAKIDAHLHSTGRMFTMRNL